ncbi:MAG: hypothetical protein OEV42_19490 [Deltaproteobacteria bacterium]|nr:hypothetical protein [Deltaproteobacteria bacterium]
MKILVLIAACLLISVPVQAKRLHYEKYYQEKWCARMGGITEYVLDDGSRVDCLTDEYAVEVDFADKWHEAVGQSLYYALKTGKKPGILLITEKKKTLDI